MAIATLVACCCLGFGVYFLQGGLAVALTSIGQQMNLGLAVQQWTVNGLTLAAAVVLVLAGGLADKYGSRPCLLMASGVFTAGLVCAATAANGAFLVAGCILVGLGGGLAFPAALAALRSQWDEKRLPMVVGIFVSSWTTGICLGPIVCGYLADGIGWRAIFWFLVPFGVLAIGVFTLRGAADSERKDVKLPVPGLVTLSVSLVLLLLGLTLAALRGLGNLPAVVLCLVGLVLLVGFKWVDRRSRSRVLPTPLARDRNFLAGIAVINLLNMAVLPVIVLATLGLEIGDGYSALAAGVFLLTMTVGLAVMPTVTGVLSRWLEPRIMLLVGCLLTVVATVGLLLVSPRSTAGFVVCMVLMGIGFGLTAETMISVTLDRVPAAEEGKASGLTLVGTFLGGAIGLALATAVFASVQRDTLTTAVSSRDLDADAVAVVDGLLAGSLPAGRALYLLPEDVRGLVLAAVQQTFSDAFASAMIVPVVAALAAFGCSVYLLRLHRRSVRIAATVVPARSEPVS